MASGDHLPEPVAPRALLPFFKATITTAHPV
jgi:hypothetical protein